jgi:hypothetical protein
VYQTALREYPGLTAAPAAASAQRPQSSSDVQALTPQIDRTFIDRIVELSATNTSFRSADVDRRLTAIAADGKGQVWQFDALYDEFSRVSLRSGPSMYRIERPAQVQAIRSFTSRSLVLLILAVFFGTPFVLALGCLAHHALHQIAKRPLRA